MKAAVTVILVALVLGGCAASQKDSSEAAWARAQCNQIVDRKLQEKCLERVEAQYGR